MLIYMYATRVKSFIAIAVSKVTKAIKTYALYAMCL